MKNTITKKPRLVEEGSLLSFFKRQHFINYFDTYPVR